MSIEANCFRRFTIEMNVRGIAFVGSEAEQRILHDKIAAAIEQAILEQAKDSRISIGTPKITTAWNL
jgi:hypothetical protein